MAAGIAWSLLVGSAGAQDYQSHFPPEEFRTRWAKIYDRIGSNAVAFLQGAPQVKGFNIPRQTNNFYYLTGIETPHAYLFLDGRARKATLFLPPRNERLERSEGKVLSADDAQLVRSLVGVDNVESTELLAQNWLRETLSRPAPVLYTPFSPAEGHGESRGEILAANARRADDYWDGQIPREGHFRQLFRTRFPRVEVRDLTPIMDDLRLIKSEREIALIRRASQLAGLGLMEAMRSTKPGVYEYQLEAAARYVFAVNGARLDAYRAITASGVENINNPHYFRNTRQMQSGDLVLMDYAPDYHYYVSDIGRVWPVSGEYSPWQRELLSVVLAYHKAVLARIRPGVTPAAIHEEAARAMEPVFARTEFSKPIYEKAARRLVETGGGVFSHTVGMAVHDVGSYKSEPLQPGLVFSVDPQLRVPEENLYLRYEDTVVVTKDGVENFTAFMPLELDEIERMVQERGVVQLLSTKLPD